MPHEGRPPGTVCADHNLAVLWCDLIDHGIP
jgi:hypothetical protein